MHENSSKILQTFQTPRRSIFTSVRCALDVNTGTSVKDVLWAILQQKQSIIIEPSNNQNAFTLSCK